MRRLLLILAAAGMIFTACENSENTDNNTSLPKGVIATIEQQSANIKATIATLETTKSAVNATIASHNEQQPVTRGNDNGNNGVKDMIAALEERLAALEQMIANLKEYADGDLSEMQDWAEATFATMEQYNALASELATLKALLEGFEGVSTAELSEALAASEQSMKQWVNEQLSGYATIAEVDAQIAALKESLTAESNEEVEKVAATLTALMNDTKQEYEKAITEAIQNQGVINDKIAKGIADINKRIDEELATINKRLDDIEKRLDEIEGNIKDLVSRIQSISYLKKHGALPTPVEITAEKAIINLDFKLSPKSVVASLADNWSECLKIKAYYKEVNTKISLPIETLSADEEDGTISLTASAEGFSDEFFSKIHNAYLYLNISDGNNDRDSEVISICPQIWCRDDVIDLIPNNNEIYYTTGWDTYEDYVEYSISTEPLTTMPSANSVDATAVSCLYDWRRGVFVITFDKDVTELRSALLGWFNDMGELAGANEDICALALPESLTKIGSDAFYACFMVSLRIPKNVTSIGDNAFYWGTDLGGNGLLRSVYFDSPMPPQFNQYFGGATPNIYVNIESVDIYKAAWPQCADRIFSNGKHEEIPDIQTITATYTTTDGNIIDTSASTLPIASNTYENGEGKLAIYVFDETGDLDIKFTNNRALTSFTIPEGITLIGEEAFYGCSNLTSITIPDSVTSIGSAALYGCSSLTSITIPNSVTSIGENAFYGCTGELIIDSNALGHYGGQFTKLTIGNNVTSIGYSAFYNCSSLTSITIPDSVTSIGDGAFYGCSSLTSITIPDSVTSIGQSAFSDCSSLTSITIPDSVTSIGECAFYGCSSLKSLTIPDSVTSIGNAAFYDCKSLTSITIPDSVTSIGNAAFYDCKSLTSVYCKATTPSKGADSMFSGNASGRKIYVPTASVETYKSALYWSDYADYIFGYDFDLGVANSRIIRYTSSDGNIVTPQDDTVFGTKMTSNNYQNGEGYMVFANIVSLIGKSAFKGCSTLTSIIIPDNVTTIEASVFSNCSSLTSVTIGNSVTSIGGGAFSGCSSLTSVTIPDSVTSIGQSAFSDCSSLTSVTIPDSVTLLGSNIFCRCTNLTEVNIPNSITKIDTKVFYGCSGLTNITIPNNVTAIYAGAFYGCSGLTSITIPDSVTSIGRQTFYNCSSLTSVYCKATTPPKGGSEMFNNNSYGRKIYVPTASVEAYKSAEYWKDYASDIVGYDF